MRYKSLCFMRSDEKQLLYSKFKEQLELIKIIVHDKGTSVVSEPAAESIEEDNGITSILADIFQPSNSVDFDFPDEVENKFDTILIKTLYYGGRAIVIVSRLCLCWHRNICASLQPVFLLNVYLVVLEI